MDKSSFWNLYLSDPADDVRLDEGLAQCRKAFAEHRSIISQMIGRFHPHAVAVLGAGYLSDLPLSDLFALTDKLYLVDWIEGAGKIGLSRSIVNRTDNGFNCLFCKVCTGHRYCRNFTGEFQKEGVCSAFELIEQPAVTCGKYEPADNPVFVRGDVTAGVASRFAAAMEKLVAACLTPKDAFIKAIKCVDNIKRGTLPLADSSIDLATSSMVVSQFDAEPYAFFALLLRERFGQAEIMKHEAKLRPLMEQLRTRLFVMQVETHIRELYRILKKDGGSRAYLAMELFRAYPEGRSEYFLVQDIAKALEVVDKYFSFQLDDLLGGRILSKMELGDGISVNQNYVLIPKPAPARPPHIGCPH
ncbi:MAG: hypothetical protein P8141_07640 [Gammaproteobacteria bacterium]